MTVSFPDDTAPLGFDNDGNYNATTGIYIAAQGGVHRFHAKMSVKASFATAGTEFNVIGRLSSGRYFYRQHHRDNGGGIEPCLR